MGDKQDCVYILLCADQSLYTGWTNHLSKRLADHQSGHGAKYTRSRLPIQLVYCECFSSKNEAMQREYEIKQLSRAEKIKVIENALIERPYELENCGLSAEKIKELLNHSKEKAAWEKALQLLSSRAYSSGALEEKLCRLFGRIPAAKAIARVKELGYLDDKDYGQRLAIFLHKNKSYSGQRIRQELYKRKIDERLITEIMKGFDEVSEVNAIIMLLQKKYRNKPMDTKNLEKTKLWLGRRGFKYSHIVQALQQVSEGEVMETIDERIDDVF